MLINMAVIALISMNCNAYTNNNNEERITYTSEEMKIHKNECLKAMMANPNNFSDRTYDMRRACASLAGNDCDYIPKVHGAGDIFHNTLTPYQLMHNGIKVILKSYYDSQWLTDVINGLKGHHEPQEEKCFYEVLKHIPENATMIELGSYWAYYSLWFASEIKGGKNYLIEPDSKRLEIGKKNFELNNKKGIFKRGYAGVMIDRDPDANGAPLISIDEFMDQENIQHLHILHADIQGSEAIMLQSTIRHLNNIDYFFISTHDVQSAHIPCLEFFKRHDFIILAAHTVYESFGGDGLIVAKRKGVAGPDHIDISKYYPNA